MFYFHMNSLKDTLGEKYEEKNKKGWRFIHILAVAPLLGIERNSKFPNILLPYLIIYLFLNELPLSHREMKDYLCLFITFPVLTLQ